MPTPEQLSDLSRLRAIAEQLATEITIIGATALQCFMDLPRFTNDVDLVVALDLENFSEFAGALQADGWLQEERREHRWKGPSNSLMDIVPAGPGLRAARQVVWPESEFAMSLIGFEHVFMRAVEVDLGANVRFGVAPPSVLALLKIVAYMDDPNRRRKDLDDLRFLLHSYEKSTERIFSDEVFAAELKDIDNACGFLLGMDVGTFATEEEAAIIQNFLTRLQLPDTEIAQLDQEDFRQRDEKRFQGRLQAFSQGFLQSRNG